MECGTSRLRVTNYLRLDIIENYEGLRAPLAAVCWGYDLWCFRPQYSTKNGLVGQVMCFGLSEFVVMMKTDQLTRKQVETVEERKVLWLNVKWSTGRDGCSRGAVVVKKNEAAVELVAAVQLRRFDGSD